MNKYLALFERANGSKFEKTFEAPNLEDATIEATNYSEDNNLDFLAID